MQDVQDRNPLDSRDRNIGGKGGSTKVTSFSIKLVDVVLLKVQGLCQSDDSSDFIDAECVGHFRVSICCQHVAHLHTHIIGG